MVHSYRTASEDGKYGYFRYDKKTEEYYFIPLGNDVTVSDVQYNITTKTYYLTLNYEYDSVLQEQTIPREDICGKGLLKYAKYGLDVTEGTVDVLVDYIRDQEATYLEEYSSSNIHQDLGWFTVDDEDGQPTKIFLHSEKNFKKSKYIGKMDIHPKGTFNDWKNDIENMVLGNAPMETIVVIALSAVLFGYFREQKDLMNPIVHICGDSSSGKSTALMAGIATAGNPSLMVNGLAKSWKSTGNAFIGSLKGIHGVPVGRDELSMYSGSNLSDLVYQISQGRDKERLDKDSRLMDTDPFTTVMISTGECSMLSKCSGNTGLYLRIIELKADVSENGSWTLSADNAEKLKKACLTHYGKACSKLAHVIRKMTEDELEVYFQQYRQMYLDNTSVSKLKDRASLTYAMFLMTAAIMNDKLDVRFDVSAILEFLLRNEAENSKDFNRDLGQRFYQKFMEYVWINRTNFIEDKTHARKPVTLRQSLADKRTVPKITTWGIIKSCESLEKIINGKAVYYEVTVRKNQFMKIVADLGFEDSKNILKRLKEDGLLNCEKDRYTRNRKIDANSSEEVYVFWFVSEPEETDELERELIEFDKKVPRKPYPMVQNILDDIASEEEDVE